jgi:DNA-binding winged helix-turn-helix (wHTH) protein
MLNKRRIYEFDDFRVDTGQFFLTRSGRSKPITPTVFRILQVLLERAGDIVTKEELMGEVWPDSHVEEGNLNRNVSTLRKALGEKPSDHKYIETVPKSGYRLVTPVRASEYQPPAGVARKPTNPAAQQIVGRDAERKTLGSAYDRAHQGSGNLMCIAGDVGLGKTALVDAFLEDLTSQGHSFNLARARCSESFTDTELFMPWIEGFTSVAQLPGAGEAIDKAAPTWAREIRHDGSSDPRKMKRELVDLCASLSTVHPLIVVLDDFQWADAGSVDLLAYLATRLESSRVLVIVCYRLPDMKMKNHPFLRVRSDLLTRGACREIHPAPLSRTDVDDYISRQPGRSSGADEAAMLYAKSDGNPLFLKGLMSGQGGKESIRHIIEGKIARLDDTHKQLLVTASVQGREFDSAVLSATMQMASQDVEEALQDLDEIHGFVQRIREEELPDGKYTVRYRFIYSAYQEACYASLAPTRKAALSSALAEAFLAYYSS